MGAYHRAAHDAVAGVAELAASLPREAARRQELYDLAALGPGDCPAPYDEAQRLIERAIRALRVAAREIKALRTHKHDWGEDDYCRICGNDGRA